MTARETALPKNVRDLVGFMLAAGGPPLIPARIGWPLHQALYELHEKAGRSGDRRLLPQISFRPSPDVALRADGADEAMRALVHAEVLQPEGAGRQAMLRTDSSALVTYRRNLMRLDPDAVRLVQFAGTRWAALVATSAKNRSTAPRSSGSARASATPNRLQVLPGTDSSASSARVPVRKTRLVTR